MISRHYPSRPDPRFQNFFLKSLPAVVLLKRINCFHKQPLPDLGQAEGVGNRKPGADLHARPPPVLSTAGYQWRSRT